jgi:hypothetical protein
LTWSRSVSRRVRQRFLGGRENPASECLDGGIAQAIIPDDELIIVRAQFGSRDRTNQTAGGNISLNQRQRSQGDAEAIDGRLKLKIDVIELEVPNRRQA